MTAPDLIVITDDALSDDQIELRAARILREVPPGSTAFQVRDRRRSARALLALAERLRPLCARHGAPLFVNDRLDVAVAIGADGVHLGGLSVGIADARHWVGARAFVSTAAHEVADVVVAAREGARASLVSPIYATPGKGAPRGARWVSDLRASSGDVLLYALGGVDGDRAAECVRAGAFGVAAIRSVWGEGGASAARTMVAAVRASR